MNHFSVGLWHVMKSRFYSPGSDQLSGWTEKKLQNISQSHLHQKKLRSLFGGLLPLWSTTAFRIPVKPLHLRSRLSGSMNTKTCNASQHQSTERAQFTATPSHMLHSQCFKSRTNQAMKFYLIHHIHPTSHQQTTSSSSSTTFCRENISTTSRRQKILSKNSSNRKAQIFML